MSKEKSVMKMLSKKKSFTLCLFQDKGKKVMGRKNDGRMEFPLFGTTKRGEGKILKLEPSQKRKKKYY